MKMECTQRLESTQELFGTQTERTCPEQIGFLGICGTKYPVKKGPNKIGRDPQTCTIVLNLNSVSRQHAVINILNKKEFMLMDLDSANKTKLVGKTLQPYIPHPLKNGDTVQFGEVFGIFRLLEEEDDLPMTQALDIPDTPVFNRHVSKLNNAPITTIPESPDVSDKEESFIVPSQTRDNKFKNSYNNHFIKPSSKTISIQPVGTNKIDNIYWNSSKKSKSLNLDNSDCSFNDSIHVNDKDNSNIKNIDESIHEMDTQDLIDKGNNSKKKIDETIHEMETQDFNNKGNSSKKMINDTIHEMETQVPYNNVHDETNDSIYTANTQLPPEAQASPSIHSLETQLPVPNSDTHLPQVHRIEEQQDLQLDLYASDKENDNSIFNAETQLFPLEKSQNKSIELKHKLSNERTSKNSANLSKESVISDDVLFFEEVNSQPVEDDYSSQPLLPPELPIIRDAEISNNKENKFDSQESPIKPGKRTMRLKSDSSTDCEDLDILPTQKIPEKKAVDDDLTDCEDDIFEADEVKKLQPGPSTENTVNIRFDELATQVIDEDAIEAVNRVDDPKNTPDKEVDFEDMLTQVIEEDVVDKSNNDCIEVGDEPSFEELPTQIIEEDVITKNKNNCVVDMPEDFKSPFKVPLPTPLKVKRKDVKVDTPKEIKPSEDKTTTIEIPDDDKYYAATQEIFDDLCTQREPQEMELASPVQVKEIDKLNSKKAESDKSSDTEQEEHVNNFVAGLSSPQIRDMIGVEQPVTKLKKQPSDASDCEVTPKKIKPLKFMEIDLPNSQEIKSSVTLNTKSLVSTESSSESENDSEEQFTPILFKKKRAKPDAKIDLTKKFDVESLPTRVITRVRKPTAKLQERDAQKASSILKPKFLTEQEDGIDKEILNENISRLKNEKAKNNKSAKNDRKSNETKEDKDSSSRKLDPSDNNKTDKSIDKSKEKHKNDKSRSKESKSKNKDDKKTDPKVIKENTKTKDEKKKDESTRISDEHKSTRSTRSSRNKQKTDSNTTKKSTSPDKQSNKEESKDNSKTDNRRRNKKQEAHETEDAETEVRRSKRQRAPKETKDDTIDDKKAKTKNSEKEKPKSKRSKPEKHEQSTVYNISSESGVESPRLKRPAGSDFKAPSPKRTRSANTAATSLRATPARSNKTHHVLFTAFPCEEVKVKLEKLGAVIVTDVTECTVLLTMQIKRTFKLLCAVGLGVPIVGPNWVQACSDTNMIVDPWLYLIKDEAAEKRFQFGLERTLIGKRGFLAGYNISCTPNVLPSAQEMKLIVESSGGTWQEEGAQWVCVSCSADKSLWPALKRRGATIVSTEFILGGVLRQKVNVAATKLG